MNPFDRIFFDMFRLRAELETAKGQAEFYRTTRNWSQQKAERLEEALRNVDEQLGDVECESAADARDVERCHDIIRAAIAKATGGAA